MEFLSSKFSKSSYYIIPYLFSI